MELLIGIYVFSYLAYASYEDLHTHSIDLLSFLVIVPLIPLLFLFGGQSFFTQDRLIGTGIGIMFLIISLISRNAFGIGDAAIILWLGYVLGMFQLVQILSVAWLLCFLIAVFRIIKGSREEIPFIPLILIGFMVNIWM